MALRIVDTAPRLERALTLLTDALSAWSGGADDSWTALDRSGARWAGASYSDREACYIFVERTGARAAVGVALSADDLDVLRLEFDLEDPAGDLACGALAIDESDRCHALFSRQSLAAAGAREPLAALAGFEHARAAAVGERDFVLIGPFEARAPQALLSLAATLPAMEAELGRRSHLGPPPHGKLYPVTPATGRRAAGRALAAAWDRLTASGWSLTPAPWGVEGRRAGARCAVVAVSPLQREGFERAVGALALCERGPKLLLAPAAREGAQLPAEARAGLERLGVRLVGFDLLDGGVAFAPRGPGGDPFDLG